MSASVDVETQSAVNVVAVPIQAVVVRDFAKLAADTTETPATASKEDIRRVVFLMTDGLASMVEVETGINDDQYIQIVRGVDEAASVVTGSYRVLSRELKDKQRIRTSD